MTRIIIKIFTGMSIIEEVVKVITPLISPYSPSSYKYIYLIASRGSNSY